MPHSSSFQEIETAPNRKNTKTVWCSLILTRRANSQLLLLQDGPLFRLPRVEIPMWERAAPHLISYVYKQWGIEAICLFSPQIESLEVEMSESRYYVLEAMTVEESLERGVGWMSAEDATWERLALVTESVAVRAAMSQAKAYDDGEIPGTFVRSGWFNELTAWIELQLSPCGLRLAHPWVQYNLGPSFCLLRHETSGSPVWFKAVGEPNLREYWITASLAGLRSRYLPKVLATHHGWHGWLMSEADGHHLDETWDIRYWQNAARSLATLQLESSNIADSLLAAGCKDLRLGPLALQIEPFLDVVADLMAAQPVSPPRVLVSNELRLIEKHLRQACNRLAGLGFPDAVGHVDLNPGNVLVNNECAVFIDWAEGIISHPLFTMEYLLALLRRLRPELEHWCPQIREAYCQPWSALKSPEQLTEACQMTPLVAVFAFALACSGWNGGSDELPPSAAKLMRSLARLMFGEACKREAQGV